MELMPDGVTRKPETNTISKPIEDILNLIDTTIVPSLKHIEKKEEKTINTSDSTLNIDSIKNSIQQNIDSNKEVIQQIEQNQKKEQNLIQTINNKPNSLSIKFLF
jgi:hypothetical protein